MRAVINFFRNPPTWVLYAMFTPCFIGVFTNPINDFFFWNGLVGSLIWGYFIWQRDKFRGLWVFLREILFLFSPFIILGLVVLAISFFGGVR